MLGALQRDLKRSQAEGWHFGAKVVRGAYMVSEREKAKQRGLPSPVCETYDTTNEQYHQALDCLMKHNAGEATLAPGKGEAELVIATHNRDSVEFALSRVKAYGKNPKNVHFGQLLGMADHLTFTLGIHGYKAYKYVPYGPIDEVMPYLLRRTQENSTILGSPGVQEERGMISTELRRRLSPW
jgi:proline dehydrogenase